MASMPDDSPPLVRPIPRRPFGFSLTSVTPPADEDLDSSDFNGNNNDDELSGSGSAGLSPYYGQSHGVSYSPHLSNANFLAATQQDGSLSRAQSVMNLTSSTLQGIYSPSTSRDGVLPSAGYYDIEDEDDELGDDSINTPWGTGAHTPMRRPLGIDDSIYNLMRERRHALNRRRSSNNHASDDGTTSPLSSAVPSYAVSSPPSAASNAAATIFSMTFRGCLLFALGVGYGILLTRFQDGASSGAATTKRSSPDDDMASATPHPNSISLAFYGLAGVALGALLPWLDAVWEETFPSDADAERGATVAIGTSPSGVVGAAADWVPVIRAVGAFVGIVFAIRKSAWSSTLQVSATLALVNPLLWWLIDRSKVGLLLSSAVGLAGAVLMLGVDPSIMPTPSGQFLRAGVGNDSIRLGGLGRSADYLLVPRALASPETVETGVWMLTLLFCSCLCFGNIGRRLTWSQAAGGKGRWGMTR